MKKQLAAALICVLTLAFTACQPQPPKPPPTRSVWGSYAMGILTHDGSDRYTLTDQGDGFVVAAPTTNTSGNLRVAIIPETSTFSTNQQACVTWDGPLEGFTQPGLTLRVQSSQDSTKAIMVTNNIVYHYRTGFNVHLAVSTADPRLTPVGSVVLPDAVGPSPFDQTPPPWRLCARAIGDQVELKVWALDQVPTEPAWGDPQYGGTVALPEGSTYSGQAGYYTGHLSPGQSTTFRDGAVQSLEAAAA